MIIAKHITILNKNYLKIKLPLMVILFFNIEINLKLDLNFININCVYGYKLLWTNYNVKN